MQQMKPSVTGLEGVVAADTAISHIDGEKGYLIYRGKWAKELALQESFESVSYLLWKGESPAPEELKEIKSVFAEYRSLPAHALDILQRVPADTDLMSGLRTVLSSLADSTTTWPPTLEQVIKVTAVTPTIVAALYRKKKGLEIVKPDDTLGHIENYLYMLTGERPEQAHVRALEAYAILTMEHGMNASTFTARVVSSTESDLISSICGAIGTMKGPLHGGAPSEVISMLDEIQTKENTRPWLEEQLKNGNRLMGFGHRIYKTKDPRSEALKLITQELAGQDEWLDLAAYVEAQAIDLLAIYKPGRSLYTNVEFYAAAVMKAVGMLSLLFTPTFTVSRVVGWSAHVLEQAENNRIFRPTSTYIGSIPND